MESEHVSVQIELTREDYNRVEEQARLEHRSVSDVIPSVVANWLERRATVRELMEQASVLYRARLAKEGKLNQTPEEIFTELARIREEAANEIYPG